MRHAGFWSNLEDTSSVQVILNNVQSDILL